MISYFVLIVWQFSLVELLTWMFETEDRIRGISHGMSEKKMAKNSDLLWRVTRQKARDNNSNFQIQMARLCSNGAHFETMRAHTLWIFALDKRAAKDFFVFFSAEQKIAASKSSECVRGRKLRDNYESTNYRKQVTRQDGVSEWKVRPTCKHNENHKTITFVHHHHISKQQVN